MIRDLKAVLEGLLIGAIISVGIVVMWVVWVRLIEWLLP